MPNVRGLGRLGSTTAQKAEATEQKAQSFADYFLQNKKGLPKEARNYIENLNRSEELVEGYQVTGKLTLNILQSRDINLKHKSSTSASANSSKVYILPQLCQPLGKTRYYYMMLFAPAIAYRLESVMIANELYQSLFRNQQRLKQITLTNPVSSVLIAITPKLNMEGINSER